MTDDDKMLLYIYVVSVLIKILKTSLNCPLNTFIYFTYISFHTLCLLPTFTWCRSFLFIYLLRRKIFSLWQECLKKLWRWWWWPRPRWRKYCSHLLIEGFHFFIMNSIFKSLKKYHDMCTHRTFSIYFH